MKRKILSVLFWSLFFLSFTGFARAEVCRVIFDAWTQNIATGVTTTNQSICFRIDVFDTENKIGVEAASQITITAPDGTIFYCDYKDWDPFDPHFFKQQVAANFIGGIIPSGTYKAVVTDNETGKSISRTTSLTVNFMDIPQVLFPTPNMVVSTMNKRIDWKAVPGAKAYSVLLYNDTLNKPVIWNYSALRSITTNKTYYDLRYWNLIEHCHYSLMIEARDNDFNVSNRSQSQWIPFVVIDP
jgi:hypothetical protein